MSIVADYAGVLPTTHRRMTADEYFRLPEGPPYFQLIKGELFMSPSPNFYHQEIVGNLFTSLNAFVRKNQLGKVIVAPSDVELGQKNVFQPDIYFLGRQSAAILTGQGPKGAPDLVVEVLSPGTAKLDLGPKKSVYAEAGVKELWVIWPEDRVLELYRPAGKTEAPAQVLRAEDRLESPLLPGWSIVISEIFE